MKACILWLVLFCLLTFTACTNGREALPESDTVATALDGPTEGPTDSPTEAPTAFETETETVCEEETVVTYQTVQNPIVSSASDPWVVEHDGHYYYCRALNYFVSGVMVSEVPSPYELNNEDNNIVYTGPADTVYAAEYWAPELHYINGEWYIYVAADDGKNENHRMYVLKGTTQNPTDPFEMVGQITDPSNRWAIDGSVLEVNGELYFVWSGWKGKVNVAQNIYIAHMSDPCTIDSERVLISEPTYAWERVGEPYVNEGPTALYHGEDTFLVYSASGSWTDDYCLGLLTLVGDDPMNPDSWKKSAEPVFKSRPSVAFGPGHCSFITAADDSIWMLYHANLESGTGWAGRSGWIAPITFAANGTPIFGVPERRVRFPVSVKAAP